MITHREAEILTSSRQDAPLDPVVERELQAHLATCDECRAFAAATERLTAGIQALPSVPVNPRIRREVMEKVKAGRNPLARLFAGVGGGFQTGPILAAAATLVIIGLFGWMALDRMVFDDGGNDNNQIAAVPTEVPVDLTIAQATETEAPTETAAPAEPTATTVSDPTATSEPEPTATTAPEPTATTAPVPTATNVPAPTATNMPEPTATDAPEDLTTLSVPVETETSVADPTATTAPKPTATDVPAPTATMEPEPTATTAPEPTATVAPDPTETPGIEPMDGQSVVDAVEASNIANDDGGNGTSEETIVGDGTGASEPTSVEGTGSNDGDVGAPIEPTGDSTTPDQESTGSAVDGNLIEPINGQGGDGEVDGEVPASTPDDVSINGENESTQSLIDVSERYTGIDGDPAGKLGLTPQGRLEFMAVPDGASMTTAGGFRLQMADSQPGVVNLCGDGYCEPTMETPEDGSWQGDVPLGVMGDTTYFLRLYGDRTEVYSASSDGTQLFDAAVIGELGPTSPPSTVYANEGILFAWLPSGEWLEVSGGSAQVYSGSYANPTNIRFAPVANQGPLLGYFSNGTLVIAPTTAPDSPVLTLPTDGVDFDMTPLADRVAVIRGNDIVIYDAGGNVVMVYEGGDMQPGSVIWLNGGIVFVDRNTGNLYQIPETAT